MLQAQCLGAFLQIECSSTYMKNYSHSSFRFCSNMNSKERLFLFCLYDIVTTITIQLLYFKNHKFYFSVLLVMFQVLSTKQSFSRVCAVTQSCPNLCDPMECSPPDSSPWELLGKNTGMGCNFFLRGIFPIQQLEPTSPGAQAGRFFLPLSHLVDTILYRTNIEYFQPYREFHQAVLLQVLNLFYCTYFL